MKNDKEKKLFEEIGGIGDDLIEEADSYKNESGGKIRKTRSFVKFGAVAASFLLVAALSAVIFINKRQSEDVKPDVPPAPITFSLAGEEKVTGNRANLPDALRGVTVSPETSSGKIIPTGESLIIKTSKECDADTVASYMTVSPKTNLSLTKLSDNEFKVTPASGDLYPGTVYNFSFGDPENPSASYTFQTESELFVKSILPADESTDVPVNSGIEITFSEAVAAGEFKDFIKIEPEVPLKFKLYPNGRILAAVPERDLERGTVYTVTVSAGLTSSSGKQMTSGATASFCTEFDDKYSEDSSSYVYVGVRKNTDNNNYMYSYSDSEYIYSEDEEVGVIYYVHSSPYVHMSAQVSATLFKYPDARRAAEEIKLHATVVRNAESIPYSTEGLTPVGDFEADSSNDGEGYISFGSNLEKGVYLARIDVDAKDRFGDSVRHSKYFIIQVSDLRAFTISSDGKTLVRIDSVKGGPVTGADLTSYSFNRSFFKDAEDVRGKALEDRASTDNGVASLLSGDGRYTLILAEYGDESLIICAMSAESEEHDVGMSYLYTDRETYFQNDKVNVFGFALPVTGRRAETLYLMTGDVPLGELSRTADGSFFGSFDIENMSEGGIYVKVVDSEERIIASKYVRVTEEEKPKITASLTFDKLFYRFGETVNVTLKATFFDGTPAEGFEFTLTGYPFGEYSYTSEVTDKNGEILYSFQTGKLNRPYGTDATQIEVTAELTGFESQTLCVSRQVYYFHSDYVFRTHYDNGRRTLTLNKLDTSKLKSEEDFGYGVYPDNTVGEVTEGSVNYALNKYEIVKTETEAYDYVAKRSYTKYTFQPVETTVESGTFTFENGKIELPMKKVEGFVGGYSYVITFHDENHTYTYHVSATESDYVYGEGDAIDTAITFDKDGYGTGDTVKADLSQNGYPIDDALFVLCSNGIRDYRLASSFETVFEGEMVIGADLFAAYFDPEARAYSYARERIPFDVSTCELNVTLDADREKYSPGDSATLHVKVADAPGATVVLSVVDEACFALDEQDEDSAKSYYESARVISKDDNAGLFFGKYFGYSVFRGGRWDDSTLKTVIVNERFSVSENVSGNAADGDVRAPGEVNFYTKNDENGVSDDAMEIETSGSEEGQNFYVRKYFADNPEFSIITLDEAGEGTLVFTVPDNITSWRITACAVDGADGDFDSLRLGNAVSDVICTKDMFINLSAPSFYIKGDDAALLARAFGVKSDGKVEYTARISDDAGREISSVSASDDSKGYAEINFGKLDEGHYSVTVFAKTERGDTDALVSEFDVIKSAEVMRRTVEVGKEAISSISPALYPVTLSFYNKDTRSSLLSAVIYDLEGDGGYGRSDALVAKYAACKVSERLFGTDYADDHAPISDELDGYGGELISLLRYSEGDAELTAQILTVAPELISSDRKIAIARRFTETVFSAEQTDEVTLCASLAGLSALGEPILDVLYKAAETAGNYPPDAKLYLASAFASLGDWSAAADIYYQVKEEYGVDDSEYGTLKFEYGADTTRLTSLALTVSSRISKPDAASSAKYLFENRNEYESSSLALASYVKYYIAEAESCELKIVYRIGGEEKEAVITPWNCHTLTLSKSGLESFEVVSCDDGIGIDATYYDAAENVIADSVSGDRVTVTKTVSEYQNGLYKVSLNISGRSTRVSEWFDISDAVPSGARYFESYTDTGHSYESGDVHVGAWVYNSAGQKVAGRLYVYNNVYGWDERKTECPEYNFSITVSYVIRGAVKGDFVVESAVVRNLATDVYSTSERMHVTIGDGAWTVN